MPFAITHFLATAALMKFSGLRLSNTKLLTSRELFLAALIGLLPDLDMLVQLVSWNLLKIPFWPHRIFTHNLIIPFALLLVGLLLHRPDVNRHASTVFFLASLAWTVHVALDFLFMGPVWLLAPLSWQQFMGIFSYAAKGITDVFVAVDALLLVGWLGLRTFELRD